MDKPRVPYISVEENRLVPLFLCVWFGQILEHCKAAKVNVFAISGCFLQVY